VRELSPLTFRTPDDPQELKVTSSTILAHRERSMMKDRSSEADAKSIGHGHGFV